MRVILSGPLALEAGTLTTRPSRLYLYMSLPCGDAPANLIKTKIGRVGVPRNVITHKNFEVNWLVLQYMEVTLFSTECITTINHRPRTDVLAVDIRAYILDIQV